MIKAAFVICLSFNFYCLVAFCIQLELIDANVNSYALRDETANQDINLKLLVITVATNIHCDGFIRFNRSVHEYGLDLIVLGSEEQWIGGNMANSDGGGGQKINLFNRALSSFKSETNLVILFVDSYDLIVNSNAQTILSRFKTNFRDAKIVFSSESTCWPDSSLASSYPVPLLGGYRYLNSGAFIGYASTLNELMQIGLNLTDSSKEVDSKSDDQLLYTKVFLNETIRRKLSLQLDNRAQLFQNLFGSETDIKLEFTNTTLKQEAKVNLINTAYSTNPIIVHGNGPSKISLNNLGNYLANSWTLVDGCLSCRETKQVSSSLSKENLPTILISIFIDQPTPFLDNFFDLVKQLSYPKEKIHLLLRNNVDYHNSTIEKFERSTIDYASYQSISNYTLAEYLSYITTKASKPFSASNANNHSFEEYLSRSYALEYCNLKQLDCKFIFMLDSLARLSLNSTLESLIKNEKKVVAPLLGRPRKLWSNFWGSIDEDGFYERSSDYIELVEQRRLGIWNVALVMNAILIRADLIEKIKYNFEPIDIKGNTHITDNDAYVVQEEKESLYFKDTLNPRTIFVENYEFSPSPHMAFASALRSKGIFQYINNELDFGHLVDPTNFNISRLNPNFDQLEYNIIDWSESYLHENFSLTDNGTEYELRNNVEEPCQDVYWFPLVNERFCAELLEIMEDYGQWSGGTNDDPRISGGYENVPTRDIHFKQVGLHQMWLTFLNEFVSPLQQLLYLGYEHEPASADLAFVVRYNPAEQSSLRPHNDASTYTLNIALNSPGIDYEGGGCRFVRYNCSVVDSRKGWALIHPGRLTHYHEGLPVTNGTRYIMVTFVDP